MKAKNQINKRIIPMLLTLAILVSSIVFHPIEIYAAGWPDTAKELTLGTAVTGSIVTGDYNSTTEDVSNSSSYYWNVYRFTMPENGLLNIYVESSVETYLKYNMSYDGFAIFSAENPDNLVWRSCYRQNQISKNYAAAREMYYGSTEISLDEGAYYFVVRRYSTVDTPYYLTLSYVEPVFNVTSIQLDKTKLVMQMDSTQTINATVMPNNATNKTILWKSSAPSVATVKDGVVTAVSPGTASIIATSQDGSASSTCEVIVEEPLSDYEYCILDNDTVEITKHLGTQSDIVIPSELEGKKVSSIGDYAFQNCSEISSLEIPNSVDHIGEYSFQNCSGLTSIDLPYQLTEIGDYAFQNCSGLAKLSLPDELSVIGRSAFASCDRLTEVILPENLKSIGGTAFYACGNLAEIEIPESVESIGTLAFDQCAQNFTMIVTEGSYGETYAESNNISYKFVLDGQLPSETKNPSDADKTPVPSDNTQESIPSSTPAPNTPAPSAPAQNTSTEKTSAIKEFKLSSVQCKRNTKKITGKVSVSKASVKIKVGKKAYKKATVKGKKFTLNLKSKLKKKTKITVKITKKGYKSLMKSYIVK